jgi:AcrR family transcriptional regulator
MNKPVERMGRPTLQQAAALKEALLAEAFELLCARGPHGFTMDRLAQATGITKRTMYRHYRTKEALIEAVVAREFDRVRNEVIPPDSRTTDPLRALEAWSRHFLTYTLRPDIRRFATMIWFESMSDPELAARMRGWTYGNAELALSMIIDAQRAGQIAVGEPKQQVVLLLDLVGNAGHRKMSCYPDDLVFGTENEDAFFRSRWSAFLTLVGVDRA